MKRATHFYREVLDPVEVESVITHLTKLHEQRGQVSTRAASPKQLTSHVDEHMQYLRQFTPDALVKAMTNQLAIAIVEAHKTPVDNGKVSPATVAHYTKTSKNNLARYCAAEQLSHPGDLSPVVAVSHLFEHSRAIESATWDSYRSALLFAFWQTRANQIRRSEEHAAYDRAVAILLVVTKAPHANEKPKKQKRDPRAGIPPADLAAICKHLDSSTVNRSSETKIFLQASVATGFRPCEWLHAEYIEPIAGENDGYPTLFVRTAKDKTGAEVMSRTLVLRTKDVQQLVLDQLHNVESEIAAAAYDAIRPPLENFTRKVSALVKATAQEIWPNEPKRWPTLYCARHQARADFAKAFDEATAAGMLGHGFDVGRKHYAPRRRGADGGPNAAVGPGADVIKRANEIRAKFGHRNPANQPWKRSEPHHHDENTRRPT